MDTEVKEKNTSCFYHVLYDLSCYLIVFQTFTENLFQSKVGLDTGKRKSTLVSECNKNSQPSNPLSISNLSTEANQMFIGPQQVKYKGVTNQESEDNLKQPCQQSSFQEFSNKI